MSDEPLPAEAAAGEARPGAASDSTTDKSARAGKRAASAAGGAPVGPTGERGPDGETAELLALIDQLERLLTSSDLDELEVQVGGTSLRLRKPGVLPDGLDPSLLAALTGLAALPPAERGGASGAGGAPPAALAAAPESGTHTVLAPLTGIFYTSPAPGAAPYLRVGGEVSTGQVIGLIEAMKLFNEIKSDVTGKVVRIVAENGKLVKAKQPLIEVEPA
ncbi:MAG TPA: biotin/lipoyl-containing protein [Candidatus Limnocylindrales bacterium]|nr:biotin/lipoyl-containing protein [Candidatus Limnocylindrales bacterium]